MPYDFSYLLQPAPGIRADNVNQILDGIPQEKIKEMTIRSLVLAIVSDQDTLWLSLGPNTSVRFTMTEKNIDKTFNALRNKNMSGVMDEVMNAAIKFPSALPIYNDLFNFEIDLLRRKTFDEPNRLVS